MLAMKTKKRPLFLSRKDNGRHLTPQEFDRADFDELWRYELVNGVLIVSPIPFEQECDLNEELGVWLKNYQENHPKGSNLDKTLFERTVTIGPRRRRADRCIWAGLGRLPRKNEKPTIVVEFVSKSKRDRERDYETIRDEYLSVTVAEYWIIDRFDRTMVVFSKQDDKVRKRIIREDKIYKTPLLPGFELPPAKLFALADQWPEEDEDEY